MTELLRWISGTWKNNNKYKRIDCCTVKGGCNSFFLQIRINNSDPEPYLDPITPPYIVYITNTPQYSISKYCIADMSTGAIFITAFYKGKVGSINDEFGYLPFYICITEHILCLVLSVFFLPYIGCLLYNSKPPGLMEMAVGMETHHGNKSLV